VRFVTESYFVKLLQSKLVNNQSTELCSLNSTWHE